MSEFRWFPTLLRQRFTALHATFLRRRLSYPQTADALRRLREAIDAEVPRGRGLKRPAEGRSVSSRKHYLRARRLKTETDKLRAEIANHTKSKATGYQITPDWLLRIFLAMPAAGSRGMEHCFRDVVGADGNLLSRRTIGRVRDAWVELYKSMVLKVGADRVAGAIGAANDARVGFAPLYILHVQDEADIRLRSGDALGVAIPRRSRASKVQQNVVELVTNVGSLDIPTELEALGDKTAATLATCFERLLRSIAANVLPPTSPRAASTEPETWLFHIIVGDGIATNEAAAKFLWSCMQQRGLGRGTRYFLLLIKCGTHQVGLTAKSAVVGRAAAVAGGKLYQDIAGVCVRLFKYLICDYYDEFVFSAHEWALRHLEVLPQSRSDAESQAETARNHSLYTAHVVPDEMVALWNNGLHRLCHLVRDGLDPLEERPRVVAMFVQWIVKHLLHVDSSPTLTRFFTFRNCTDRMLTMELIGMPPFKVRSVKPRKQNQKRLRNVNKCFNHSEAPQMLRRTSLCFQLTGGVEAMVSEVPAPGKPPPLVRLCNNEATKLVEARLRTLLGSMAASDPSLDVGAASSSLLAVAVELELRMRQFSEYPALLCRMSKKWFPCGALSSVHAFLCTSPWKLDVGAGLPLHALAWERGSESAACIWLLSSPVQDMIDRLAEIMLANSLDAERRHAQVKKWEGSKLTHIATASRNAISMRFLRWRQEQSQLIDSCTNEIRKVMRTNLQSLAWQQPNASAWRSVGIRWTATRQPNALAAGSDPALAVHSKPAASTSGKINNYDALQRQKDKMTADARTKLDELLRSFVVPVTRPQWSEWLDAHLAEFRTQMVSAPARRRQGSVRVRARHGLPSPAKRLQPQADQTGHCREEWARNLENRMGWHGVKTRRHGVIMVFLVHLRGRTYYVNVRNRAANKGPTCLLDSTFGLVGSVYELAHLEDLLVDEEVLVTWEFQVKGAAAGATGVLMSVERCREIVAPATVPRQKPADGEGSDGDDDDDDLPCVLGSDAESSDGGVVVDTDAESDADSLATSLPSDDDDTVFAEKAKAIRTMAPAPAAISSIANLGSAAAAPSQRRHGLKPLWSDDYFWIWDSDSDFLKVRVRSRFTEPSPLGMGPWLMSKQVTPREFGETRDEPVRSLLLLRAWTLWRARQNGWAEDRSCRKRHFQEQEALLERDVKAFCAPCRLLGNATANAVLRELIPSLVERLLSRCQATCVA